jgi:hypothetical protein
MSFAVGGNGQDVAESLPERAQLARFGFRVAIEILLFGVRHGQARR